jgi:hypothetical protein
MDPSAPGRDTSTYEFLGIDVACKAPFWSTLVDVPGEDLHPVADQLNDRGLFQHVADAERYLVTYRNSHPDASSLHLFLWAVYRVNEDAVTNRPQPMPGGSSHEPVAVAADLLERVARGEMEPSAALKEWPGNPEADALLDASWHDLSHFAIDADIRAKDPQYARYQVSLLLKRAKEIREKYPAP